MAVGHFENRGLFGGADFLRPLVAKIAHPPTRPRKSARIFEARGEFIFPRFSISHLGSRKFSAFVAESGIFCRKFLSVAKNFRQKITQWPRKSETVVSRNDLSKKRGKVNSEIYLLAINFSIFFGFFWWKSLGFMTDWPSKRFVWIFQLTRAAACEHLAYLFFMRLTSRSQKHLHRGVARAFRPVT